MTDYSAAIATAKMELESYSEAQKAYYALDRRLDHVKFPGITSGSPTVGMRRGFKLVDILTPQGKPTGKKRRESALVPCPICVQTQHNPHKEEEAYAEQSYLLYEMRRQTKKCEEIREKLESKIGVLREPYRSLLKLKYLEMLKPENIMIAIRLYTSERQYYRVANEAIEEYARIHGFIKESCV